MKNTIVDFCKIGLILFFTFFFSYCSNNEKNKWEQVKKENAVKFAKKKLILPQDGIEIYNNRAKREASSLKIVTYIDGSCSICAKNLLFWEDLQKELKSKGLKCEIIIYLQAWDQKSFEKEYIKKLGISIPYYFDRMGAFIEVNNIYDKRFQTFLVNEENEIILFGDIVFNPKLKELFIETIQAE